MTWNENDLKRDYGQSISINLTRYGQLNGIFKNKREGFTLWHVLENEMEVWE